MSIKERVQSNLVKELEGEKTIKTNSSMVSVEGIINNQAGGHGRIGGQNPRLQENIEWSA